MSTLLTLSTWSVITGAMEKQERAMRLMQVREAARELGVHENTLRRWEDAGVIRAVHLPSGVRRFRPQDVEKLQREMYDQLAAPALAKYRVNA
jgi:excisionase family DNA binding protein